MRFSSSACFLAEPCKNRRDSRTPSVHHPIHTLVTVQYQGGCDALQLQCLLPRRALHRPREGKNAKCTVPYTYTCKCTVSRGTRCATAPRPASSRSSAQTKGIRERQVYITQYIHLQMSSTKVLPVCTRMPIVHSKQLHTRAALHRHDVCPSSLLRAGPASRATEGCLGLSSMHTVLRSQ